MEQKEKGVTRRKTPRDAGKERERSRERAEGNNAVFVCNAHRATGGGGASGWKAVKWPSQRDRNRGEKRRTEGENGGAGAKKRPQRERPSKKNNNLLLERRPGPSKTAVGQRGVITLSLSGPGAVGAKGVE